jgi:hypothetical protein
MPSPGSPHIATKARIVGQVVDGFGNPLKDALASIEFTTFTGVTDEKGQYTVGYVPGKFQLRITKAGYTSETLPLEVAVETTFPAAPVTLYRIPDGQGVWIIGESDYVPLPRGKLSFNSKEFPPFSQGKPLFKETYTVTGDFVAIDAGTELAFLDNDAHNQQLFAVAAQGVILSRAKTWGGTKDEAQILPDKVVEIAPGVWLRRVTLAEGSYAFVTLGASTEKGLGGIGSGGPAFGFLGHPIREPVYLFEVLGVNGLLLEAADKRDLAQVQALLDKGADVNVQANNGLTALMVAARRGDSAMVEALLARGADVNVKTEEGETALMRAARGAYATIVQLLLGGGADVNVQIEEGETALMYAVRGGDAAIVQLLLDRGADVSTVNRLGQTALMLAAERGHAEIVRLLKSAGAKNTGPTGQR